LIFHSAILPNLRTLILGEEDEITTMQALNVRFRINETNIPILAQLKALAAADDLPAPGTTALEVVSFLPFNIFPFVLPSTLQVLRLVGHEHWQTKVPPLSSKLVNALRSHAPLPVLKELHIVGYLVENDKSKPVWDRLRSWCEAGGVRLFVNHPAELWERNDASMYPFLDGVRRRLGLDV
jgi:hypothetical protein